MRLFHSHESTDHPTLVRWAGHSHVCRKTTAPDKSLPEQVALMKRQGLDYFGFGHPWEPWDLELIRDWELHPERKRIYREEEIWKYVDPCGWLRPDRFSYWKRHFSCDDFLFGVDLETPKIRFGHLWWLGWQPESAPWHDYDSDWTKWEATRVGPKPPFRLRMPAEVIRAQVAHGALPVYAHPTSWWLDHDHHITNISSTLVPDILTSQASGCLVVMGYEADHAHYQELWFALLNEGFFLTGVAETDACLDMPEPFERAVFHNITPARNLTVHGIKTALKLGHNIMSTGPLLYVACGEAGPGDIVESSGGKVFIKVNGLEPAHRHCLTVIFNGKPVREEIISGESTWELEITHEGTGWLVVKVVNQTQPYSAALTNPLFFNARPVRVTGQALQPTLVKWWDYPGAMDLLYYLSEGHWRKDFPGRNPGEIPWEAFRWVDWKALLQTHQQSA